MNDAETIKLLLSVIAGLLAIIAFFLVLLLKDFHAMVKDVRGLRVAFLLFRQRICLMLNIPIDEDETTAFP